MSGWKFLTNHALVLCLISKQKRITARDMAKSVGVTEKAIRNIIMDLESEGYITKKKEGRCSKYQVNSSLPLRHETHQDKAVGEILEVLKTNRKRKHLDKESVC